MLRPWSLLAGLVLALAGLQPALDAQATVFGSACSGLNPAPAISFSGSVTPNHFGTVHLTGAPPGGTVVLIVGTSDTSAFGIPLPFDLNGGGVPGVQPGCFLNVSNDIIVLVVNADGLGEVHFSYPQPANIGADLYFQWAVVESVGPDSITLSEGLHVHVTAVPDASPAALDFAPQSEGSTSPKQTLTLTNNTDGSLNLTDVIVTGAHAADFNAAFVAQTPISLPAGQQTDVDVTFTPGGSGPRSATLEVQQSGLDRSFDTTMTPLSGIGIGAPGAEVLFNAGGPQVIDGQSQVWTPEYGVTGGLSANEPSPVTGGPDPALFQKLRQGTSFGYDLELPDDDYIVTLHFAETRKNGPGQRVFDVTMEGLLVVDDLDIWAAVGEDTALAVEVFLTLTDGHLDIDFTSSVATALLYALEVRSQFGELTVTPDALDFGALGQGQMSTLPVTLENTGTGTLQVDSLDFLIGPTGGWGSEFLIDLDGNQYSGDTVSVNVPLIAPLVLAPGAQSVAQVSFSPTTHQDNDIFVDFVGDFDTQQISMLGIGGSPGHPYLHVVIDADTVAVDYDQDGFVDFPVVGSNSHTHEPFHDLIGFEWTEGLAVLGTNADDTFTLPLGSHDLCLEIFDDNLPQETLQWCHTVDVVAPGAVPGVLARYYYSGSSNPPGPLLDSVPATADFAETRPELFVGDEGGVGGSPFSENVMVQLRASVDIAAPGTYEFLALGGADRRLFVGGATYTAPLVLPAGPVTVEARFAVTSLAGMPLQVHMGPSGGPLDPIDAGDLTFDALQGGPVINTMPVEGITLGGNPIVITGYGFFPAASVTVNWGATVLDQGDFTLLADDRIEFFSPPHAPGVISVTVQTPQGLSNAVNFTYDTAATPPIVFDLHPTPEVVDNPTTGEFGPDGRLYVGTRTGQIHAITYDDDYDVVDHQVYAGVSALDNDEILGLTFNPFDPPSPVRVYVSHQELYAHGGGAFSGPSPYPGAVSILEGPDFDTPIPLVTGLPTSNHDHGVNAIQFDHNGDLYVSIGSNTNAGIPSVSSGTLDESPLSASIVRFKTSQVPFNGAVTYVETAGGAPNNDQVFGPIVDVAPGVDYELFVTGTRNVYDFVQTRSGIWYATDNGPNVSFGNESLDCTSAGGGMGHGDELLLLEEGNWHGMANRNRGRYDAIQCTYKDRGDPEIPGVFTQGIHNLSASTNGMIEYRSTAFNGQMYGDLLVERWNNPVKRLVLTQDGRDVLGGNDLNQSVRALDIAQGPGGAIIGMDYSDDEVGVMLPNDVSVGSGMVAWDILPWRAPATGGVEFVIGGRNFGNLGNTSVVIGGLAATLTEVTSRHIRGIVPANPGPTTDLLNVVVTSGPEQSVIPEAFRYLFVPAGNEPGRWEVLPDMPVAVGEIGAGIIDGVLYVVGEQSNKTQAYDIIAGTWDDTLAVRPFVGHHHAAETVGGKLYLVGGLTGSSPGKLQIYDPVLDSWSLGAPMPWNGGSVSTALIGGKIYAHGGIVGSTTVDNCAVYDPQLDTWTALTPGPGGKGRNHAAAGTDGQKLYIFGGRGIGSGASNVVADGFDSVHVYDPLTDSWISSYDGGPPGSDLALLPQKRGGTGKAVWYHDEFYVFGGETQTNPGGHANPQGTYDRVDVYDPATNTWRLDAEMPTARHGIYPLKFGNRIFVVAGGTSAGFSKSDVVEVFQRP